MSVIYDDLKELRLTIAKENEVPPYCIFDDKTLIDLCEKLPSKKEYLVFVIGFSKPGTLRTEKYADEIINLINMFLKTSNITSPIEDLIPSYNKIIIEFIQNYNGKFKDIEIAQILTKTKYVKLLVERLDDFYGVFHSDFYGILKSCKESAIHYLILHLLEQNILKQNIDGFVFIEN